LPAELTVQEAQRNRPQVVVTDGRVRNTALVVRTRNFGENEANFLARRSLKRNSLKAIRRKMKMNLLTKKMCRADRWATKLWQFTPSFVDRGHK
jgi:hypothetical protein